MIEWMIMPLKRYADFKGRSRRKEYWSFFLLNVIIAVVIMGIRLGTGGLAELVEASQSGNPLAIYSVMFSGIGALMGLWWLATLVPNIAVNVRRLHDRDKSGWWYLGVFVFSMIPLIGMFVSIAYLVMMCLAGTPGPNRFGADPKNPAGGADIFS